MDGLVFSPLGINWVSAQARRVVVLEATKYTTSNHRKWPNEARPGVPTGNASVVLRPRMTVVTKMYTGTYIDLSQRKSVNDSLQMNNASSQHSEHSFELT
jgi:hypothetical protein